MASIVERFRSWKDAQAPGALVPLATPLEDILGLGQLSIATEVARIQRLLSSDIATGLGDYAWATDPASYLTPADAHLQYQLLWFVTFARKRHADSVVGGRTLIAGHLHMRRQTPLVERDGELAFVAMPSAFIKAVDDFFRVHFGLVDKGSAVRRRGQGVPKHLTTNVLGGQDIEVAIEHDFRGACALLLQMETALSFTHVFDQTAPSDLGKIDVEGDLYDPELGAGTAQVFHELAGGVGPYVRLPLTPKVRAATYLCTLFALFHEASHEIFEDEDTSVTLQRDGTPEFIREAAVDLFALPAYLTFVLSELADAELGEIVAPIPPVARFVLGTSAFISVGKIVSLSRGLFEVACAGPKPNERSAADQAFSHVPIMDNRRRAVMLVLTPAIAQSSGDTAASREATGALLELCCVEAILHMLLDRTTGAQTDFGYYFSPV